MLAACLHFNNMFSLSDFILRHKSAIQITYVAEVRLNVRDSMKSNGDGKASMVVSKGLETGMILYECCST